MKGGMGAMMGIEAMMGMGGWGDGRGGSRTAPTGPALFK